MSLLGKLQAWLNGTRKIDFLAPLAFRIFLAPIFILAGMGKLSGSEGTAHWFGTLGIPAPTVMAYVAGTTELVGGLLLIPGLPVRT